MDDASPSSCQLPGSSGRYAGVARYLASLEMAGGDLETPPVTCDDRQAAAAAAPAKPEVNGGDVTRRSDTSSPALRQRRQVAFSLLSYYAAALQ